MPVDDLLKILTALLTPLGLALVLAMLGLALKQRGLVVIALLWLWLWSTPWAAIRLGNTLEQQHPILSPAQLPTADVILVLGGASAAPVPPWLPEPNLLAAADRYLFAAKLWQAGKAPALLFSGGSGKGLKPEADTALDLFTQLGVPAAAVLREGNSRTTRENVRFSLPLLRARKAQRVLVVSSAWHLPRALLNLRNAAPEIEWIAASCDPNEFAEDSFAGSRWLPNTEALNYSRMMFKEWLGIAWARVGGN